jgi:hypothetical protein
VHELKVVVVPVVQEERLDGGLEVAGQAAAQGPAVKPNMTASARIAVQIFCIFLN